ncbi:hypothetical protein [uncultured Campylobacter sp.]|uniref:Cas10/Cmr2 second palm domain-containing protein n=1 Tax=uncultured Campylobacter sp. TaxID=218934 RepID=UPI0026065AED|nr:hypothetical protein [uncultured Campylobacter sp.]
MAKYLYGASIQGIQEYIYATNKLQEIIGASEIIDSLGQKFNDKQESKGAIFGVFDELRANGLVEQILLNAAGNFRAIVDGEENLKKIVRDLPKKIMQNAYGITISQAVAPYNGNDYGTASKELERKLKTQRNRPSLPLDMSINFMALAPKTARPIVKFDDDDALDISSVQKREAHGRWFKRHPGAKELKEFSQISNKKNKLAVIHADGNGLGVLVKNLTDEVKNTGKLDVIANFSKALDNATKDAYENAIAKTEEVFGKDDLKIKALILSGDDMTAVCDADIALEFTKNFIEEFEKETDKKKPDIKEKLTMCAGIAYCNEKFPFHYAAALAEELCGAAKKHSKDRYVNDAEKDIAPSCLMFHNVQSSNFQSWDKFIKDELTIGSEKEGRATENKKEECAADGKNASEIRCDFGPYYLGDTTKSKNEPKVENFINLAEMYRGEKSPKGKLREWIKELGINDRLAKVMLDRINEILENKSEFDGALNALYGGLSCGNLILEKDGAQKTPIYDVLQFLSVTSGAEDKKVEGKNDDKLRA